MNRVRLAFAITAVVFLACVVAQVFLAGLGVFAGYSNFTLHRDFGYLFGWLTLVLLVLGIAGRMGRWFIGASAALLVLFALQSLFVALRADLPWAAALHAVNALAIFWIAARLAIRSWSKEPST